MFIDGVYYTETELRAYIKQLQAEIKMLRETQPVLRRAFFANYKDTNAANDLYDKITEIVGRE